MAIGIIRFKIKVPDNMSDKEWNDLLVKYLAIIPTKNFRGSRYSDSWDWLL